MQPKTCSQHSIVSGFCFFWDALYKAMIHSIISYRRIIMIATITPSRNLSRKSHARAEPIDSIISHVDFRTAFT